jgi:tRNA(fMet)-specific endonuclease VapC
VILDTTFLVDLMRGEEAAVEREVELASGGRQQSLASISVAELTFGVERSDRPGEEKRRIERVLDGRPVHAADATVMRATGRIRASLMDEGTPIGVADAIVAATARSQGEPVLTRNVDDFEPVDGVTVETY